MSPIRRMPQAKRWQSWNAPEIIKVLEYVNDNFDSWFESHLSTCADAITAVNLHGRDAKSVYNKVYNMTKIMEDYVKTKKRPNAYAIIWQNKRIFTLLKGIYKKSEERKRKETTRVVRTTTIDQVTKERRRDSQDSTKETTRVGRRDSQDSAKETTRVGRRDSQDSIKETTRVRMTSNTDRITTKAFTSEMNQIDQMDVDLETVDNLKETYDANYKEFYEFYGLIGQIKQGRSELRDMKGRINQRRSHLEVMEEKFIQLRSELKEMEGKVAQRRSEYKEMEEKFLHKREALKEKEDRCEILKPNFLPSE